LEEERKVKNKISSYNLGQLRGAWGAGRGASSKDDPLIGMFFHRLDEEGKIDRQGTITKKYKDDEYFIGFFSFWDGSLSYEREIISLGDKSKFIFYDSAKEMRMGYHRREKTKQIDIDAEERILKFQGLS